MKYKAILFDLDGTLLDTLGDLGGTLNHVLQENNYPPRTMAEYRRFVGNGARRLTKDALPEGTAEDEVERVYLEYRDYYRDHPCSVSVPYPGIPELLEHLRLRGVSVAVVSNKPEVTAQKLTDRFFPGVLTVGDDGVHPRKPAPDNVYRALEELGVAPEEALYVGDTEVDLATARNAGMDAAIVGWGYRDRDHLLHSGAEEVLETIEDLWKKIQGIPQKTKVRRTIGRDYGVYGVVLTLFLAVALVDLAINTDKYITNIYRIIFFVLWTGIISYILFFTYPTGTFFMDDYGVAMRIGLKRREIPWREIVDCNIFTLKGLRDSRGGCVLFFSTRHVTLQDESADTFKNIRSDRDHTVFVECDEKLLNNLYPLMPNEFARFLRVRARQNGLGRG